MKRRCALILMLALAAGTTGCATSTRRPDGSQMFGTNAWDQAPAPPQSVLAPTNSRPVSAAESTPKPKPEGLARYFPGLQRNSTETPRVAARYRPTWFGLRPNKVVETQTYMTDARAGLGHPGPEPTSLPVALQVPTDRAVTPTNAESARPEPSSNSPAKEVASSKSTLPDPLASGLPDFGGKPSGPGEDEVNPLPPAAEPGTPAAVAGRMPELPAVDPRERPRMDPPKSEEGSSSDEKAVKATVPPADPLEPTSYSTQPTNQTAKPIEVPTPSTTVLASPQSAPREHVHKSKAKSPARPSPQVTPTSQVKPTPQSEATHAWKRPCVLKRLIHKSCKPGECVYATVTPSPQ